MSKKNSVEHSALLLDDLDWKILDELANNPRIKINELAEKFSLHRNTLS